MSMVAFSRSRWLHSLLVCGLVLAASPQAKSQTSVKRLAVLEFKGAKLDADVLDAFSDAVRGGAVEALADRGVIVMTRENMMVLLKAMGKQECSEGECEVETARNIGADYVVSGSVTRIDQMFVVTLKLHETQNGSLLGTDQANAKTQFDLLTQLKEQSRKLVSGHVTRSRSAAVSAGQEKRIEAGGDFSVGGSERIVVKFESDPAGAAVLVDGDLVCKETPCSKSMSSGAHEVEMQKERYTRARQSFEAKKGAAVHLALPANFATLIVRTEPTGLSVAVNGKTEAMSGGSMDVEPGQYEVVIDHPCYLRTGEQVVVHKGDRREIVLAGRPRQAAIEVVAEDERGNEVEAKVKVDGVEVGTAPGTFKVPVCSRDVLVISDKGSFRGQLKLVEKEVSRVRARLGQSAAAAGPAGSRPADVLALESLLGSPGFISEQVLDQQISQILRMIKTTPDGDPQKPDFWLRLGELYAQKRSAAISRRDEKAAEQWQNEAVKCYVEASKHQTFSRMDEVLFRLAYLLQQGKKDDKAREFYHRLIKDYPQSSYVPNAYLSFGEYYFAKGEMDNALKFYEKVEQFPKSSVFGFAVYKKGLAEMGLGSFKSALGAFVNVIELCQSGKIPPAQRTRLEGAAQKSLVRAYARTPGASPEKAWDFFQRMGGPSAPTMLETLADLYREQGMRDEASRVCRKLAALKPDVPRRCD